VHFVFTSAHHYPDGGAPAVRQLAIARGLVALGHEVTFVLLTQSELPDLEAGGAGVHWLTVARARDGHSPLGWRGSAARAFGRALDEAGTREPVDVLLVLTHDPAMMEVAIRAGRKRGTVVLHEVTEFPDVVARPGILGDLSLAAYYRRHLRQVDGVLVITHALGDHVRRTATARARLLGAIIDTDRLQRMDALDLTGTLRVGYAGSLSHKKDGILHLVAAAHKARQLLAPGMSVHVDIIGGDLGSGDGLAARRAVTELGMADAVTLHGQVPAAEVRPLLGHCHLMVLPRPASRQATGGFPTKLGEYLATARPVVATAVGEIPRHLRGGDTCFMVPPDDVAALARAFVEVADDYPRAQTIGERGQLLAETSFGHVHQAAELVDFVEEIREGRR
jgi:glycosyltransferase involved in cell wall biosynthesis